MDKVECKPKVTFDHYEIISLVTVKRCRSLLFSLFLSHSREKRRRSDLGIAKSWHETTHDDDDDGSWGRYITYKGW